MRRSAQERLTLAEVSLSFIIRELLQLSLFRSKIEKRDGLSCLIVSIVYCAVSLRDLCRWVTSSQLYKFDCLSLFHLLRALKGQCCIINLTC